MPRHVHAFSARHGRPAYASAQSIVAFVATVSLKPTLCR
jgi:hypothetical protein